MTNLEEVLVWLVVVVWNQRKVLRAMLMAEQGGLSE